jgi:hypothetical protein
MLIEKRHFYGPDFNPKSRLMPRLFPFNDRFQLFSSFIIINKKDIRETYQTMNHGITIFELCFDALFVHFTFLKVVKPPFSTVFARGFSFDFWFNLGLMCGLDYRLILLDLGLQHFITLELSHCRRRINWNCF